MTGSCNGLKSLNCNTRAYVQFSNKSTRTVDLLWLDYKGKRVRYDRLRPGQQSQILHTFVTHPWEFRDSQTGDALVVKDDGKHTQVYMPKPWTGGSFEKADIVIPGTLQTALTILYTAFFTCKLCTDFPSRFTVYVYSITTTNVPSFVVDHK